MLKDNDMMLNNHHAKAAISDIDIQMMIMATVTKEWQYFMEYSEHTQSKGVLFMKCVRQPDGKSGHKIRVKVMLLISVAVLCVGSIYLSPRKEDDIPIAPSLYSLSNKMDNSLLAVRDINHKYVVVEGRACI